MADIDLKACTAYQSLNSKQQKFVLEYLKAFNGTQAAIKAGYSKKTANSIAAENLTKPDIKQAIEEIKAQLTKADIASLEEVVKFLSSVMRGNIKEIVSWNTDGLVFTASSEEMDENTSRLIKKVKVTEKTSQKGDWTECRTEVEVHDPVKAAELLGRYHGGFTDKTEHTGNVTFRVVNYGDKKA